MGEKELSVTNFRDLFNQSLSLYLLGIQCFQ